MKTHYTAAAALLLLMAAFLNAQTPGKKTVTTRPSPTTVDSNQEPMSFEFEVSITPEGLAGIIARRKSGLGLFTTPMLSSFAKYFSTEQEGRSTTSKYSQNPSFVLRAHKDAKLAEIMDVINAIRVSPKSDIRIDVDSDLTIFIPKKPGPKGAQVRPNPLFLLVETDERSNILLNREQEGSFPDTSKLEQRLKQIFQEREKNGVWRQGTATTETTVLIKLPKNMTFTDLVELAQAIKRSGSDNIGLQMDETDNTLRVDISQR